MTNYRVIAIPSEVAAEVRKSNKAPRYGHPAFTQAASGHGPCRHCLRTFKVGKEYRTLVTYNPFGGLEDLPIPGPIFIHTENCQRYPEYAGYPPDLLSHAVVLSGYAKRQRLIAQARADHGSHEAAVEALFEHNEVDYIEVRDKIAGCYDFRIERRPSGTGPSCEKKLQC